MISPSFIAPPIGWASQKPPCGVPIDRAHPLSAGLMICLTLAEGSGSRVTDAAGYTTFNAGGSRAWKSSPSGAVMRFAQGYLASERYLPSFPRGLTLSYLYKQNVAADTYIGNKLYYSLTGFGVVPRYGHFYSGDGSNDPVAGRITLNSMAAATDVWTRYTWVADCSGPLVTAHGYRNGQWVQTKTSPVETGIVAGDYSFKIGVRADLAGYSMQGELSDLFLWNRRLSAADISFHHAHPFSMFEASNSPMVAIARRRLDGSLVSNNTLAGAIV